MTHYERLKRKRLGDVLLDEEIAGEQVIITALQEQQRSGQILSDILLEMRVISEYDLARVLVEQYQTPFISLRNYTLHKDLIESFPAALLHGAGVIPLDRFGRQICFACQEIPAEHVIEQLKIHAPGGMYFYVASSVEIRQSLRDLAVLDEDETPSTEEAAAKGAPVPSSDMKQDGGWKDLFDAANDEILADLRPEDEEALAGLRVEGEDVPEAPPPEDEKALADALPEDEDA